MMALRSDVKHGNLMDYSSPRLELQIIVTFLLTQAIHLVLKHLRLPTFISQILVWIILSPMVFDSKYSLITVSEDSVSILGTVASFGYISFLFLTGVKMDFSMTYRSGKKAICISIPTVFVPFIVCLIMAKSDQEEMKHNNAIELSVLAITYSGTSFPVLHSLLRELKLLDSEPGSAKMRQGKCYCTFRKNYCLSCCAGVLFSTSDEMAGEKSDWDGKINDRLPLGSALVEKLEPVVSGFLMPLGIVQMTIFCKMYDRVVITAPLFAHMILIVIVVASIVPMLVKALYDPSRKYASYHKRSTLHCKHNQELRMISCIHVPGNVNSIIDILSTSTTESPIALHVLHLIKLSGQATPLFISHDMNRHTLSNDSYSENVILSFQWFERENWRAVTVKVHRVHRIGRPNHKEPELQHARKGTVLDRDPDDQEPLALGISMSENENVQLTVIQLTAGNRIHLADVTETMQDE
ncbi:putative Cation/H+ exchanger 4 [Hibiscus syriacus]|uniref:Cation/H+ exchanger 4 n=1 Tax=Hibiscus syriacus TaxID=106335 RepID=A0A6A2X882_HIBSY|nr:putative Cation/H+ exchanger 4 [Hibiscus syriacus]